jgi:hypothetical protein
MAARVRILIATSLVAALIAPGPSRAGAAREGAKQERQAAAAAQADPTSRAGVVSQQADRPEKGGEPESRGPTEVFDDIERGWNARNVDLILRHFGAQKVAISIDGNGPSGGTFSKSQSYYLLKDHFRYTNTRKFEFVQFRKGEEGAQTFAVAERHYVRRDDGRLIKDKVYVSLHLDRDADRERWVVDEIKSIR